MSARAAFVFGVFLVLAALAHGGIYSAGHDFIVNRFTGEYRFVPADEMSEEDAGAFGVSRSLTGHRPGARVSRSGRSGAEWRAIRFGR